MTTAHPSARPMPHRRNPVHRPFAVALAAATVLSGIAAPDAFAQVTGDKRTRLLDACVYDLYFEQRSSENVTQRCRCVVSRVQSTVTDNEVASYRLGSRLTGSLRDKIYAALANCR